MQCKGKVWYHDAVQVSNADGPSEAMAALLSTAEECEGQGDENCRKR